MEQHAMIDGIPKMRHLRTRISGWMSALANRMSVRPTAPEMSTSPDGPRADAGDTLRLEDGRLVLFRRNGIWQARIHLGAGRYVWRSLRTTDETTARREGTRTLDQIDLWRRQGLALSERTLARVIDEYLAWRQRDHEDGNAPGARDGRRRTSAHMLRQLTRVTRYWRLYAGDKAIEAIDEAVLRGYVPWRRRFYHDHPQRPANARLDPADTTLRWEIMACRLVLRFADERGYRGGKPMPRYSFTPGVRRARPAFTVAEYRRLYRSLRAWVGETERADHAYRRRLLRDYVLVLANAGLRIGEANDLRWRDVEPFRDGKGRRNVRLHVRGKTGKRVAIPPVCVARHLARLRGWTSYASDDDLVFALPDGTRIGSLANSFNKVLRRAGLGENSAGEKFTLYSLRHFYAVQALARDIDVFMVARNMGTSVAMIEQHYGRGATPRSRADLLGG